MTRLVSMLRIAFAALVMLMLSMTDASTADIRAFKDTEGRSGIVLTGEFRRGDDERFATVAGTVADDATVWLDSPGGSLLAGMHIAQPSDSRHGGPPFQTTPPAPRHAV